jgi:uncharacterized protein DUF3106
MRSTHPIVWLICWSVGSGVFLAQAADKGGEPAVTTIAAARMPAPPLPKPQVDYFRELLALSSTELDRALASIAEPARNRLQAKLREYAAITPDEREARLRATELRWYLVPLMRTPPTNRVAQLALVPDEYRTMVEERLKLWDLLKPEIQKQIQESEWTIRYIVQLQSAAASQNPGLTNDLTLLQREKLEQQLASWLALPPDRRQRMFDRFQQFFELSPREKEKILSALPDAERGDMDKTLQAFEKLPSEQRSLCISSFRKFANMTPEERARFLKNAERWKEMPPDDRQTWRTLVTKLPPLPPGFGKPPLPPGFKEQKPGPATPPLPRAPINLTNTAN